MSRETLGQSFMQSSLQRDIVVKTMLKYGFTSFGTLHQQIQNFHYKFVDQEMWLTDAQFFEIVKVCESLPGSTSIQILILITTLTSKSPITGVMSFIIFCLPSVVMYSLIGVFMNSFFQNYQSMPVQIRLLILGFQAAGGALLLRKSIDTVRAYFQKKFQISIILITSALYYFFPTTFCIQMCFAAGVLISLYVKTQNKTGSSKNAQLVMRNMKKYGWIFGKWAFTILVGIYIILWIHFRLTGFAHYYFIWIFYFAGCFIFGPSATLFPLLYPQLIQTGEMVNGQFWLGVPLIFLVPGVTNNISLYYGTIVHGVVGGIFSWIFFHLPSILVVYGILPNWDQYRNRPGIQRIIRGMNCVALGFLCGCGLLALSNTIIVDHAIPIILFVLSYFLSYLGFPNYVIIIVAGFLANFRRWGLVYFRQLEEPSY